METVGLLVRLEAIPGQEDELAQLLESALPLVIAEPDTTAWFAARLGSTSFAIFDTFPNEDARQTHLTGPVAAALTANADRLLAGPPTIETADIFAAKP